MRIAAIGDTHCTVHSQGAFHEIFTRITSEADVLLLCGDLTDYGLAEEAQILAKELSIVKVPVVAVLGNHDFESGRPQDVKKILGDSGIHVLDGDAFELKGVGFAGVKGFAGGFGKRALQPWGEAGTKAFVHEAVEEAVKLESSLAKLRTKKRVVVLHYAPIAATVEGEPLEIYPFLGSSRLEDPIDRYECSAAFHGHAHHGVPEGKTKTGIPVYNVSMALLKRVYPEKLPYRIFELEQEAVHAGNP